MNVKHPFHGRRIHLTFLVIFSSVMSYEDLAPQNKETNNFSVFAPDESTAHRVSTFVFVRVFLPVILSEAYSP